MSKDADLYRTRSFSIDIDRLSRRNRRAVSTRLRAWKEIGYALDAKRRWLTKTNLKHDGLPIYRIKVHYSLRIYVLVRGDSRVAFFCREHPHQTAPLPDPGDVTPFVGPSA